MVKIHIFYKQETILLCQTQQNKGAQLNENSIYGENL